MIVIGIDPGSRYCGYGLLEAGLPRPRYLSCGVLRLQGADTSQRLHQLHSGLGALIHQYQPTACALEQVFIAKNPMSALKLGQARGAALAAVAACGLEVHDYSARAVKKALTGSGAASKEQVQFMIARLLALPKPPAQDASDALALAWCHLQNNLFQAKLNQPR